MLKEALEYKRIYVYKLQKNIWLLPNWSDQDLAG